MKNFGLLGRNIDYSFSKPYFEKKFANEGIEANYHNFDISDLSELKNVLKNNPDLVGLNVTIPYKEEIIKHLDEIDESAKRIGAVNVIKIERGNLKGYNTDIYGFTKSFFPLIENHHHKALILGSGGASKAIEKALMSMGFETQIVSRTAAKEVLTYDDLNAEIIKDHQVIVNCTPLGTHPNIENHPQLPYEYLSHKHLLYDLVYNPPITTFLALGKEHDTKVYNGQKMLEFQAEKAWEIWHQ
ncbi:MAG: shikimate dehydrogenase family protein [Psychroflexus sp.]|uniref:shikimate dehydrogenase family protein n=1 Tax=Psychroflexus sp. S27 TaxID=1982757 RepID=UPI000C296203|nr:shikimate dehydrogenase [Psychroflexus sp. S27]PJX24591.1 shikimate dehydrogenase [Psychroflexus sp. S27]